MEYHAVNTLKEILKYSNLLNGYNEEDKDHIVNVNCERMYNLFKEGRYDPNDYFDYVGAGCYKQAYHLVGAEDIVIKFCSEDNRTETEKSLLDRAYDADLEEFFIPTYFISMRSDGIYPYLYDIDVDDCAYIEEAYTNSCGTTSYRCVTNDDYCSPTADYIELQAKCDLAEDSLKDFHFPYLYRDTYQPYILAGHVCDTFDDFWSFYSLINNKTWWENAINNYGIEQCLRFLKFAHDNNLQDLHWANIGYYNGKAVIFDWISN